MQRRTAHSEARTSSETGVDAVSSVEIANALERTAGKFHAQPLEVGHGTVGDALTARLVDRRRARLDHDNRQSRERSADRGGSACWTATSYQKIDHVTSADFNAASSARMRTASSGMFSKVNTTAVTHAVCTSGKAIPSATTAT